MLQLKNIGILSTYNSKTDSFDYLKNCNIYVTLEPCLMCLGALIHSRIRRIIIAAEDKKTGVIVNNGSLVNSIFFNHKIEVTTGILAEESSAMLTNFFKERRIKA